MSQDPHSDPFRAQPSAYAASRDYLSGAYTGPPRPAVHPLSLVSMGLGAIALLLALLFSLEALFEVGGAALELLARLSLAVSPLVAIAAIVVGHVAYIQIDRRQLSGRGRAVTGFLFGYASLVLVFIMMVLSEGNTTAPGIV
ncbi:MAG TPA: DUF4190 domain-containing protein [Actinomycetales bacterium]|nr:DUF4190 domain-containing protein [Actinomycetales bacterium]